MEQDEAKNNHTDLEVAGVFTDVLLRSPAWRHIRRDREDARVALYVVHQTSGVFSSEASEPTPFEHGPDPDQFGCLAAARALHREMIASRISDVLTAHWKSTGKLPRMALSDKVLKQRAWDIALLHREAVCLRAGVTRTHTRNLLVLESLAAQRAGKGNRESTFERYMRLQDFWPYFHSRLKPPQAAHGPQDRRTSNTSVPPSPTEHRRNPAIAQLRRETSWKERGAASRVSAGEWKWGKGFLDDGVTKETRKQEALRAGWSGPHPDRLRGQMPPGLTSPPSSRGSLTPSSSAPLLMRPTVTDGGCEDSCCGSPKSDAMMRQTSSTKRRAWWHPDVPDTHLPTSPLSLATPSTGSRSLSQCGSAPTLERTILPSLQASNGHTRSPAAELGRLTRGGGEKWASSSPGRQARAPGASASPIAGARGGDPPLPLIVGANMVPWRGHGAPTRGNLDSPMRQYLQACDQTGVVPSLMPFVTGHSSKLRAENQMLSDSDLGVIISMMKTINIEEVNLESNTAVSEKVFVQFVDALMGSPAGSSLRILSLRNCPRVGQCMCLCSSTKWCGCEPKGSCRLKCPMGAIVRSLVDTEGLYSLRKLDLCNVPLSAKHHFALCRAIGDHTSLDTVLLADTGMGIRGGTSNDGLMRQCIQEIFKNSMLQHLDLSWNCFSSGVFEALGAAIVASQNFRRLEVAHCSTSVLAADAISPVVGLLEAFTGGCPLKVLDISSNHLDFHGALIMEDALAMCSGLTELVISGNPLGVIGLRSIFRLLCTGKARNLAKLRCEECSGGLPDAPNDGQLAVLNFSRTCPEGRYELNLTRPYHRSLLRMLYRSCENLGIKADGAFRDIKATPAYALSAKGADGVYAVPTSGKLAFTFSTQEVLPNVAKGLDDRDFGEFLRRRLEIARVRPDTDKVIPLLVYFRGIRGNEKSQITFLDALAKDFGVTYPQVRQLCEDRFVTFDVLARLLPSLEGSALSRSLAIQLLPTPGDAVRTFRRLVIWEAFNVENPTGHYRLDLGQASEFAVAERLKLLDTWEAYIGRQKGRPDTSEKGDFSRVRNISYRNVSMETGSFAEWSLPEIDLLELDYASAKRPPEDVAALDDEPFKTVLRLLQEGQASSSPAEVLQTLRCVSHQIRITAMQLRQLLCFFPEGPLRVECVVIFHDQVVDRQNNKVFRALCSGASEAARLCQRLGAIGYFPFMQPEQTSFSLCLKRYDQRLAANLLRQLAEKEDPASLVGAKLKLEDGSTDAMAAGVPKTWGEKLDNVPHGGVFEVTYECPLEKRDLKLRREHAEKFDFWSEAVEGQSEVTWWTTVAHVPQDAIVLAESLSGPSSGPLVAFQERCRDDSGLMKFAAFEEAFDDRPRALNLKEIFKFLDEKGEGSVGAKQFGVLEDVWQESKQCIRDCVEFIVRAVDDDMEKVWNALLAKDAQEIEASAWPAAVQRLRFCGSPMPAFRWAAKAGCTSITFEDFCRLGQFRA